MKDLSLHIKTFQRDLINNDNQGTKNDCNIFGENKIFYKLIVMNNVSGLEDKSNNFSNFLTLCRKLGYICLYIFHVIYPTKFTWQIILSQTKTFNIFTFTIQLGIILKILTNNCDRQTINYISARDLWINRFYISLSNESKSSCLSTDCRKSGPAKYRTNADNNLEQFCYYGQNKKDRLLSKFLDKGVEQNNNSLAFQIDSVINVTKIYVIKIFMAIQELKSLLKQNDGKGRGSDRQQIAEQPELLERKYFGGGKKKWKKTYNQSQNI